MFKRYKRYINYDDYLKTDWWKSLKEDLIWRRDSQCWICGRVSTLLPHHVRYDNLYKEKLHRDLYILCYACHDQAHFWSWFRFRVPNRPFFLLLSMRTRKALFYTQTGQFGWSLLYFSFISFTVLEETIRTGMIHLVVWSGQLLWFVTKELLEMVGVEVIS